MDDSSTYQHVLCLYMPDVYDKDAVTEVSWYLESDVNSSSS